MARNRFLDLCQGAADRLGRIEVAACTSSAAARPASVPHLLEGAGLAQATFKQEPASQPTPIVPRGVAIARMDPTSVLGIDTRGCNTTRTP